MSERLTGRRFDGVVEFEARRVEVGDYLAKSWFVEGEYMAVDGHGYSMTAVWGEWCIEVDPREAFEAERLDLIARRAFWIFTAVAVGDCNDCPYSTGVAADIEAVGCDKALAPLGAALVSEAARRLAALSTDGRRVRQVRMLALVEQEYSYSWPVEGPPEDWDWDSKPILVGFFDLAELAAAIRGRPPGCPTAGS